MNSKSTKFLTISIFAFILTNIVLGQSIPKQITFQGKLWENEIPVTGIKNLSFAIGNKWNENHYNVEIQQGLYSVKLGSINPIPAFIFHESDSVLLSIYVNGVHLVPDTEILSVAYAFKSENSNNSSELNGKQPSYYFNIESINGIKGDTTANVNIIGDGSISVENNLEQNTITISGSSTTIFPKGIIVMWSGSLDEIPQGWALCDGSNNTPNLLSKFIYSIPDGSTNPGRTGGSTSHNHSSGNYSVQSHSHTISTKYSTPIYRGNNHYIGLTTDNSGGVWGDQYEKNRYGISTDSITTSIEEAANITGQSDYSSVLPPYFELAFIIKL